MHEGQSQTQDVLGPVAVPVEEAVAAAALQEAVAQVRGRGGSPEVRLHLRIRDALELVRLGVAALAVAAHLRRARLPDVEDVEAARPEGAHQALALRADLELLATTPVALGPVAEAEQDVRRVGLGDAKVSTELVDDVVIGALLQRGSREPLLAVLEEVVERLDEAAV